MGVCKIIANKRRKPEFSSNRAILIPARFLHLFFPNLVCETAYELFYSHLGQHISVGNYWNDPHHQVSIIYFTGSLKRKNIAIYCNVMKCIAASFRNCIISTVNFYHM